MRVEKLSSYGADQIKVADRTARGAHNDRDMAEVAQLEAEAALNVARSSKSLFRRLFRATSDEERIATAEHEEAARQVRERETVHDQAKIRTKQRRAGESGEDLLRQALAEQLSDEWILFQGYMSRRGEADGVLVGPRGVWVIEVKYRRVALVAEGDNWRYQKLSRAGRGYEWGRAIDGGGRTWGRQASDAAAALSQVLDREKRSTPVRTAVVLTHPGARIDRCEQPGVDLVTARPDELAGQIGQGFQPVGLRLQPEIERLVRADHEDSMKARSRPGSGGNKQRR